MIPLAPSRCPALVGSRAQIFAWRPRLGGPRLLARPDVRPVRALAISLGLHGVAACLILSAAPSAEHGVTAGSPQAVRVRIVAANAAPAAVETSGSPRTERAVTREAKPTAVRPAAVDAIPPRSVEPDSGSADAAHASEATRSPYFDQGRLTRLPSPIGEVALDDDAITAIPVSATVRVTLLVRADGIVADATASVDGASEGEVDAFVARILERLRGTRFQPGEIDGAPVPARLDIVVVGRPINEPAS